MVLFRDYTGSTFLHKLDPRSKFIYMVAVLVIVMLFSDYKFQLAIFLVLVVPPLLISKILARPELRNKLFLTGIILTFALLIPANAVFRIQGYNLDQLNAWGVDPGLLFWLGPYPVTIYGGMVGLNFGIRILSMLLSLLVFTGTSFPRDIGNSLEKWKLPTYLSYMFAMTLRYIPTVEDNVGTVMNAQRIRGFKGYDRGSFVQRLKAYVNMFVPILLLSIDMINKMSIVLESRCFGATSRRTIYRTYQFKPRDYVFLGCVLSVFAFFIVLFVLGYGQVYVFFWS